jgi:hypothetical protein
MAEDIVGEKMAEFVERMNALPEATLPVSMHSGRRRLREYQQIRIGDLCTAGSMGQPVRWRWGWSRRWHEIQPLELAMAKVEGYILEDLEYMAFSAPFFVVSDDLDSFDTIPELVAYIEPWDVEQVTAAFDSSGQRLHLRAEDVERTQSTVGGGRTILDTSRTSDNGAGEFRDVLSQHAERLGSAKIGIPVDGLEQASLLDLVLAVHRWTRCGSPTASTGASGRLRRAGRVGRAGRLMDITSEVHDMYVDLDALPPEPIAGEVAMPVYRGESREGRLVTVSRPPGPDELQPSSGVLTIRSVRSLALDDQANIGWYSINHVSFDAEVGEVVVEFNEACKVVLAVEGLDVQVIS